MLDAPPLSSDTPLSQCVELYFKSRQARDPIFMQIYHATVTPSFSRDREIIIISPGYYFPSERPMTTSRICLPKSYSPLHRQCHRRLQVFKMATTKEWSPESVVPSLAETSIGSPDEDTAIEIEDMGQKQSVPESIETTEQLSPRRLFFNHSSDTSPFAMYSTFQASPMIPPGDNNDAIDSSEAIFSTTSSETTAVACKNLSMNESMDDDDDELPKVRLGEEVILPEETMSFASAPPDEARPQMRPTMVEEHPLKDTPSCNAAMSLTPRQIGELFVNFQSKKKSPMPSSPSSPQEELLLRECAALKEIIQGDSNMIVQLKQALEELRERVAQKDIELQDKDVEIRIALDRIDALKREKELMREREEEFQDTIRILKFEVDKLSTPTMDNVGQESGTKETRMIIGKLVAQLAAKEEENARLRELEVCNVKEDSAKSDEEALVDALKKELTVLSLSIEAICKRVDAMEATKGPEDHGQKISEDDLGKMSEVRDVAQLKQEPVNVFKISEDPDEVEVLLPKASGKDTAVVNAGCCCEAWRLSLNSAE